MLDKYVWKQFFLLRSQSYTFDEKQVDFRIFWKGFILKQFQIWLLSCTKV